MSSLTIADQGVALPDKENDDGDKTFPPIRRETVSKVEERNEKAYTNREPREDKSHRPSDGNDKRKP